MDINVSNKKTEVNQDRLCWNVKHKNDFATEEDFLETILMDCGIAYKDIPKFLNPNRNMIHDPFLMKNMKEAVECIRKHVRNGSKIKIKVDCDVDGYTSSSVLAQFLLQDVTTEKSPQLEFIFSEGKEHGLTYDMIKNNTQNNIDLIIIPDASMEVKEAEIIKKNFPKVDIVCLDHHLIEEKDGDCYTNYCIAVNCHDGQYPNSDLSGVGVVQKFIEAWSKTYPEEISLEAEFKYLDLVSLGISADSMSLVSLENRYYVLEGLKKAFQKNEFLNEIEDKFPDDFKFGRSITNMTWKTAPLINGVIRFGKSTEIKDTFLAMMGEKRDIEYQPRRKHKDDPKPSVEIHSLQWEMAKTCYNVKQRQDNAVRKQVEKLEEKIQNEHLDENSILFIDGNDILDEKSTVTGLVANKLASKYFRPVILLKDFDKDTYGGSARGFAQGNIKNLKSFLEKYDGYEGMGHEMAHGIRINKEKLPFIIEQVNKDLPLDSLQIIHEVDWEISAKKLKKEYVSEVAENFMIFGNDIPSPEFAISNLVISAGDITGYGEFNNFIRFVYNGIVFTKKYCKAEDFPRMICKQRTTIGKPKYKVRMNLICQFVLNAWEDKVNPEVKILYFDSIKDDGSVIDDFFDNNIDRKSSVWISTDGDSDRRSNNRIEEVKSPIMNSSVEDLKEKEEPVKKKRGRPKKESKQNDNIDIIMIPVEEEAEDMQETKQEQEPIKKKRGRPRKPLILDDDSLDSSDNENLVNKKVDLGIDKSIDNKPKKKYSVDDEDFVF